MLTFLSFVCSVSPEAAAASGAGLRKHWKGVVRFISPLLVHFKLSNSCQQKYGVIIRKTVLRNTDWVNLWMNLWKVCHKTMLLRIRMFFEWVYASPWPSPVGIWRIPAYHIDYTTSLHSCSVWAPLRAVACETCHAADLTRGTGGFHTD